MRKLLLLALLAFNLSGCVFNHGRKIESYSYLLGTRGVRVTVELKSTSIDGLQIVTGELLAVQDTALLLLKASVLLVPRPEVSRVHLVDTLPKHRPSAGSVSTDTLLQNLRRFSRFPYGVPAAALDQLLREHGQSAPRTPTRAEPHLQHSPEHNGIDPVAAASFLRVAREATARYRSRAVAIADGYRRLGPAFPGMGQHWVHPGLIVSGRLDARQPSVLCYVDSAGIATLVGLAYAVPVRAGAEPPVTPLGGAIWHTHGDAVDAETLLLVHPAPQIDGSSTRLAMFHAWPWLENPDGPFAQNNWAVPFAQLALSASHPTAAAGQALSLLTVGESYFLRTFELVATPSAEDRTAIERILRDATRQVEQWRVARGGDVIGATEIGELEAIWTELWRRIDDAVSAPARDRISRFPGRTPQAPGGPTSS